MTEDAPTCGTDSAGTCCAPAAACVFAKALFAGVAACSAARREDRTEGSHPVCTLPAARVNCTLLLGLLRERARFALHLPGPSQPLRHQHSLQLQCGGLVALATAEGRLCSTHPVLTDVQELATAAQARHSSLTELPWPSLVAGAQAWQPRRRHLVR